MPQEQVPALDEYRNHLQMLDAEDIIIPNQSLIIDFFCTDSELTDFLRAEVFNSLAARNYAWKTINLRRSDVNDILSEDQLSALLDFKQLDSAVTWAEILRLTAIQQSNKSTVERIQAFLGNKQLVFDSNHVMPMPAVGYADQSEKSSVFTSLLNENIIEDVGRDGDETSKVTRDESNIGVSLLLIFIGLITGFTFLGLIAADSSDDKDGLTQLETESKNAVLICEHRPVIETANSLNLNDPSLITQKNKIVSDSNKAIAFLDQTSGSGSKYWEDSSCTWGQQWFDKHASNEFRVFIAISKKCSSPVIHYKYTKDKEGKVLVDRGTYNAAGHHKGEIRLPFPQGHASIFIEKVTCT